MKSVCVVAVYTVCMLMLHLKYLCKLARHWLQAPREWHDSVETFRGVIIG